MRVTRTTVAALALVALAAACGSGDAPSGPPPCDAPVETDTVTMGDFYYEPTCVQASNGDTITVINEGDAPHTFTVKDMDLQSNLEGHDEGELTIQGLTAGTVYEVICIYHSNMTAALKAV